MRLFVAIVFVLTVAGCASPLRNHAAWYNPFTLFSGREARAIEKTDAKLDKSAGAIVTTKDAIVHSANAEVHKAQIANRLKTYSPAMQAIIDRFLSNGARLLNQVSPITAADLADLETLVQELTSENAELRASGEAQQKKVEQGIAELSRKLEEQQKKNEILQSQHTADVKRLEEGFARENSMANDYRNLLFKFWGAIAISVLLLGLVLYLRIGLGSVGAALPMLPKLIGHDQAEKFITEIDSGTDWLHQWLIRTGREKAEALMRKAERTLGIPAGATPTVPVPVVDSTLPKPVSS